MARTARTAPTAATSRSERVYELFLGYACNERCLFCSQELAWRGRPALDFAEVCRRVYRARAGGAAILAVNGGEPTIFPDLPRIVAFGRRAGFPEIHLQTNGVRLADADYAAELVRAGLSLVRISVHGHTPELHDGQVLLPGALEAVLAAIGNLRGLGLPVGLNLVVTAANAPALRDFFARFLDLGLSDFGLIFPLYEGDMARNAGQVGLALSVAAPHVAAAFELFRERRAEPPFLLNVTPCVLPGYEGRMLRWSSDGAALYDRGRTIVLDPEDYVLDRPDAPPRGLAAASREGRLKPAACARCVYDGRCLGPFRRYVERFGEAEFRPLTEVPEPIERAWGDWTSTWRRVLSAREHEGLRRARR